MFLFNALLTLSVDRACEISSPVAYPELVSRGVSERRKCKWLVRVGASNGVTPLIKKNHGRGGGVCGQPENPLDTPL